MMLGVFEIIGFFFVNRIGLSVVVGDRRNSFYKN